jgi:hypothetical protein
MELNDFISDKILGIVFNSREEYKLLSILNGLDYDIEFMISNPFKIEEVIEKVDINYLRDNKLEYILGEKPLKKRLVVVDLNMISKSKTSHFDLFRELIDKLIKNNVSETPIILLNRGYPRKDDVDISIASMKTSISSSLDTILSYHNDEFTIIKSREYQNGTFKANSTI